jgi:glycosyltransferase involved in cell wall biosynthesis
MKKILFFINSLCGGGAEKVLVNLINNLNRNKYEITLITLFGNNVNESFIKSEVKRINIFSRAFRGNVILFKLFNPKLLYKLFIRDEYDIVVSYLEGVTARIVAGCPNESTKKISWIHGEYDLSDFLYPYRNYDECLKSYNKFDQIVCVSKDTLDSFIQNIKIKENVIVKYNTVETEYIQNRALESVDDIKSDDKLLNVISVGRLRYEKGFDRLLHAHKKLIEEGIKHRLFILGEGTEKGVLQKYIDENHLNDSVQLIGFRTNPWKYIKNSDLFICSSRTEGFSTAITEALILGIPVVSTLCPGANELLGNNNEYGLVVDNSENGIINGLKELLTNEDLLSFYRNQATTKGKQFSTEKTVNAVEEMLDCL